MRNSSCKNKEFLHMSCHGTFFFFVMRNQIKSKSKGYTGRRAKNPHTWFKILKIINAWKKHSRESPNQNFIISCWDQLNSFPRVWFQIWESPSSRLIFSLWLSISCPFLSFGEFYEFQVFVWETHSLQKSKDHFDFELVISAKLDLSCKEPEA